MFQVFQADTEGRQISNRKLKRSAALTFFANLPSSVVGVEACAGAHYRARMIKELGREVRLIQPIRVKAFLGNRDKTDAAEAKAICEALMHPGKRFVSCKIEMRQDMDHSLAMGNGLRKTALKSLINPPLFWQNGALLWPVAVNVFKRMRGVSFRGIGTNGVQILNDSDRKLWGITRFRPETREIG